MFGDKFCNEPGPKAAPGPTSPPTAAGTRSRDTIGAGRQAPSLPFVLRPVAMTLRAGIAFPAP